MKTSLHHKGTQPSTSTGQERLLELPTGAIQLDVSGRSLHRLTGTGFDQEPRCKQIAGENFFHEHWSDTQLAYLEQVYLDGVRDGELYHFVDVEVGAQPDTREMTLFLYYHASSGQGWLFIEPHSMACDAPPTRYRRAA